jgi:hypothetical protein
MAIKIRCPSCGASLSAPNSYHGKNITCPKCKSSCVALTEEDRQREKEHLRLETEKRKLLQEKMARLREEKREEEEERGKAGEEEMANREQKSPAEDENESDIESEKPLLTSRTRNCPDCGGIVSKEAATCPHCGRPFREQKASITQVDPFAEFHTPIAGKKKGKITPIGWMGICLGIFLIAVSPLFFSHPGAEETGVLMVLLGVFFLMGCYFWARVPEKDA